MSYLNGAGHKQIPYLNDAGHKQIPYLNDAGHKQIPYLNDAGYKQIPYSNDAGDSICTASLRANDIMGWGENYMHVVPQKLFSTLQAYTGGKVNKNVDRPSSTDATEITEIKSTAITTMANVHNKKMSKSLTFSALGVSYRSRGLSGPTS